MRRNLRESGRSGGSNRLRPKQLARGRASHQGRKITSNVWLSRAVHDFLLIQEKPGLAVDLDISKAYDQVSRTSLRRLWTALGGSSSLF